MYRLHGPHQHFMGLGRVATRRMVLHGVCINVAWACTGLHEICMAERMGPLGTVMMGRVQSAPVVWVV